MQDVTLLKITVVSDDDTGIYNIGELDFGKTGYCENYLKNPENRANFVKHLRWLSDAAENGTSPFFPIDGIKHPTYGTLNEFLQELAETIKRGEYPRIGHVGELAWFIEQYGKKSAQQVIQAEHLPGAPGEDTAPAAATGNQSSSAGPVSA